MANYYFRRISDGEKHIERSLVAINKAAKREATRFGQAVQVFVDKAERGVGVKSHRQVSMARNPSMKGGRKPRFIVQVALTSYGPWRKSFEARTLEEAEKGVRDWERSGYAARIKPNNAARVMTRNPIDFAPPEYWRAGATAEARESARMRAAKPKRAKMHARRGWVDGAKKPAKAAKEYTVFAPEIKFSEVAYTLESAKSIARSLAKQGYRAEVHEN